MVIGDASDPSMMYNHFIITIRVDDGISSAAAFDLLYEVGLKNGYDFTDVLPRNFRMIFRSVDISEDDFIRKKIKKSNSNDKIFCLPIETGYIFFGRF